MASELITWQASQVPTESQTDDNSERKSVAWSIVKLLFSMQVQVCAIERHRLIFGFQYIGFLDTGAGEAKIVGQLGLENQGRVHVIDDAFAAGVVKFGYYGRRVMLFDQW